VVVLWVVVLWVIVPPVVDVSVAVDIDVSAGGVE
jgi:hypothetical protein